MSSAPQDIFPKDAWQNPRNARTLRAYMALRNQEIAERIIELRKRKHVPQSAVWTALGMSERGYQNWEAGRAKPNYTSLQKLAEYFGVTEGYILEGVDDRPIIEGVPEQLESVDGKFSELVAAVQDQLDRVEQKLDRLMHLVDTGLFVSSEQPAEPDGDRRQQLEHREEEIGLTDALRAVFEANPEATQEALRRIARAAPEPARAARAQAKRRAG